MSKIKKIFTKYASISLTLFIVFVLLRIYEYFTAGIKLTVDESPAILLLKCIYYDLFTWGIYVGIFILPFFLLYLVHQKLAIWFYHLINILVICIFFGLLVVYLERLIPFDHEIFVRSFKDTLSTSINEVSGRFLLIAPMIVYVLIYIGLNVFANWKVYINSKILGVIFGCTILALIFINYSRPSLPNHKKIQSYYLVNNKLNYFASDCYTFLNNKSKEKVTSEAEVQDAIKEYQSLQNFKFVDPQYPFLHVDESKDVLKDFFRKSDTIPNIVIIIFEGLSRDFSGKDAMAGSFTPFLDSLADKSLSWYNCLSNGQGTFGSLPSIIGSLPFGDRGFTLLTPAPEHLSLVKILKKNNWGAYYFAGGEINFDNFGGFMRLQGVDYISSKFNPKYKMMGVDREGMSAGYPDDALFNNSLEVLKSIQKEPYISVYLTLTTHTPFIFDQAPQYRKIYEEVIKKRNLKDAQKKELAIYKDLWVSCLFSDNCLRNFFKDYQKKKEYQHTIFVITGDHHHGYYPTRNEIDDFNVPLIIYSPLLKKAQNFSSVNSHLNIAPTLLAFLKDQYQLKYYPRYVSWLGDVLDTCRTFRNNHHLPFMLTNRDINDYLYENNYVGGQQLYQIAPRLELQELWGEQQTKRLIHIRENFKIVNRYVCQNNRLFPKSENIFDDVLKEIKLIAKDSLQDIKSSNENIPLCVDFYPPSQYKRVEVQISFYTETDTSKVGPPMISTSIQSGISKKELLNSTKNMWEIMVPTKTEKGWWFYSDKDLYDLSALPEKGRQLFHLEVKNLHKSKFKIKGLRIKFLGIE